MSKQSAKKSHKILVIVGYVLSFFPLIIYPFIFGLVGVIVGTVNIIRGEKKHGMIQILLSITLATLGYMIGNGIIKI